MKLSLKHFFTAILFASILFLVLRPITDADFWWHLATGRWMADTGQIPQADPFSYTAAGDPWTAHEWLTEKGMYALYLAGGVPLLILVFSTLITLAYGFAYFRSPGVSRPYIASFAILLAAAMSAPLWGVRPQMITLLFSSIFLYLLDRYEDGHKIRFLVWLPVLMLLWVNMHAGYFMGLVLIGIYLLANLLQRIVARIMKTKPQQHGLGNTALLVVSLVVSVLAALINPQGPRILLYPFETLADPAMQAYIQEWYPPDFRQAIWLPFLIGLGLIGVFGILGRKKLRLTHFILLLVFGYLGLRSMRHVPLFAVVTAPILAGLVQGVIRGARTWRQRDEEPGCTPCSSRCCSSRSACVFSR